ncbi:hypothetical protein HXX76_016254 [Chlamydomonas incerta]|uniref:Uncharacterized protein n=1 Tax=Chlamydomonas incerta TaxID=51695 RepID=A0A835VQI4_CHLIN|nr:hypothetical protein HXX76_016254 [Chlamydomonas incerta]|eukprot:KAG2422143.1 hypothetical protein HXX76_016254 [Chlamydomonas incerta]
MSALKNMGPDDLARYQFMRNESKKPAPRGNNDGTPGKRRKVVKDPFPRKLTWQEAKPLGDYSVPPDDDRLTKTYASQQEYDDRAEEPGGRARQVQAEVPPG